MKGKKKQIIDVAAQLFFARGISDTSMEFIAEQVPVAKMTIYNYFQSKEGLLEQIIMERTERMLGEFRRLCADSDNPFEIMLRMGNDDTFKDISSVFLKELFELYPGIALRLLAFQKEVVAPELEQMIFKSQQAGMIRKEVSPHVLVLYMMAMKEVFAKAETWQGISDIRAVSEQLQTLLYYGLITDEYRKGKGS